MTQEALAEDVDAALERIRPLVPGAEVTWEFAPALAWIAPTEVPPDDPMVRAVERAAATCSARRHRWPRSRGDRRLAVPRAGRHPDAGGVRARAAAARAWAERVGEYSGAAAGAADFRRRGDSVWRWRDEDSNLTWATGRSGTFSALIRRRGATGLHSIPLSDARIRASASTPAIVLRASQI